MSLLLLAAAAATLPMPLGRPQHAGRFTVTPIEVEEDSRCPMNARCVWAGRVVVRATVREGRRRTIRRFTLGEPTAPGIVLDSVTPERMAGGGQRPLRYRVHFSAVTIG